jgi:hypothetical protein
MVTHDPEIARQADHMIRLVDGRPAGSFPPVDANQFQRWREADVDLLPGVEGAQARVLDVTIRPAAPGPFTESRWELWAEPLPSVCLGGDR